MPIFTYQARNKQGERVHGEREAPDKHTVLLALRDEGLFVTQLIPAAGQKAMPLYAAPDAGKWWLRSNPRDLSLYFRQLQALLKSGTSLIQALNASAESAPNKTLRQTSLEMAQSIAKGKTWSDAMRYYPGLFPPLTLALIRSGEMGGFLDAACRRLADYAENDHRIRQVVARETWYPKTVIFTMIITLNAPPLVVSILQHRPLLPAVAQYLMGVGIPLLIIAFIWLATSGKKFIMPLARHLRPFTFLIDQIKLLTPVASKTVRNLAVAKFCRAFGALNSAGVGIATSLNLAAEACGNEAIAARVRDIIPQVEKGKGITDSLAATGQFQPAVLQMMRTGEVSGNFDDQLSSIAEFMEQEGESSIRKSMVVLGILALLGVGIIVGIYVINFYVGYFNNIFNMADSMQ